MQQGKIEGLKEGELKRRKVIEALHRQGIITKAQADTALAELDKK